MNKTEKLIVFSYNLRLFISRLLSGIGIVMSVLMFLVFMSYGDIKYILSSLLMVIVAFVSNIIVYITSRNMIYDLDWGSLKDIDYEEKKNIKYKCFGIIDVDE